MTVNHGITTMNIICPYCDRERSTNRVIGPGTKVRCPGCKNVFTPVPVPAPVEELAVLPDPDPEPPPPTEAVPLGVLPPRSKQLHGNYFKPMEASRKSMAIVLAGGLIGSLVLFVNWYTYTVKHLDVAASKAARKRGNKIENLASPKSIYIKTAEFPKVPAAALQPQLQLQPVGPSQVQRVQQPVGMAPTLANNFGTPVPPPPVPAVPAGAPGAFGVAAVPVSKNFDPAAEKKADSKLYQAQKLEKEGKVRLAAKLYEEILDKFPNTEAAKTAETHATKVVDHRVDVAQEQLAHAEQFERVNSFEEAKAEYEGLISRYPETEAAKTARSRLANLKR